jgi:hypothetical protein
MADFAIPNLCGASPDFNKLASQFDSLKNILSDNLETDPASLASLLSISLIDLELNLREMIPKIPTTSTVNFQAEVTSLAGLVPGSSVYLNKLELIKSQFGSVLPDIDSLITSALAATLLGGDVCSTLPNLELPSGSVDALEKAQNSLQANAPGAVETIQSFSTDVSVDDITGTVGDAFARAQTSESVETLESSFDNAKNIFNGRAERLAKELKVVQIQKRLDEVIAT